jgi:hypothetical protein
VVPGVGRVAAGDHAAVVPLLVRTYPEAPPRICEGSMRVGPARSPILRNASEARLAGQERKSLHMVLWNPYGSGQGERAPKMFPTTLAGDQGIATYR